MRRVIGFLARHRVAAALLVLGSAGLATLGWVRWSTGELSRRGERAMAARDYPAAHAPLARYLEARPGDPRARLLAARCARCLREYYEAGEHLRLYRDAGGDKEAADVEEALGRVQRGDAAHLPWLRARAARGDEVALAILEVLIQHDLNTYQLWQALSGLDEYLARRPGDLQALLGRGYVWERVQYYNDALRDYREAVRAHPGSEEARSRLADTLLVVGTPAEALTQYRWLAEQAPGRADLRLGLARCLRLLGEEGAKGLLDGLLAERPEDGMALWERGLLALDEDRPAEAEPRLRSAARLLPHDRRVHHSLSRCLQRLGRVAEAAETRARVERLDADLRRLNQVRQEVLKRPDDAGLRVEGGLLFLRNGERPEGARWLHHALRLEPSNQAARDALAEAGIR